MKVAVRKMSFSSTVEVSWTKLDSVSLLNIDGYKVRIIRADTWSLLKEETALSLSDSKTFYSIRKGRYRAEVQITARSGSGFENSEFVQSSIFSTP